MTASIIGRQTPGGALTAVSRIHNNRFMARCSHCGQVKSFHAARLYAREMRSCGCLRKTQPYSRDAVIGELSKRMTERQIADSLGMYVGHVSDVLGRLGLSAKKATRPTWLRPGHVSPEERAAAVRLANAKNAAHAARVYRVHERTIQRWRNGHVKRVAV